MDSVPSTSARRKRRDFDPPDSPHSVGWTEGKSITLATAENPFILESGRSIGPVVLEYEEYGKLSAAKDNVVLIVHALSGDAHVAGWDKHAKKMGRGFRVQYPGWWDTVVGPGKAIDTNRHYVLCSNYLGSCYGTTGPASINPATGKPYGISFPMVTVSDWVNLQIRLLDALGITKLKAVVGGSLGGQQALEWALAYPDRVEQALVLAASPRLSSQGLAFNAVGRHAIMTDPNFRGGDYYGGPPPEHGLAVARMLAHITYLSEEAMTEKFGRENAQTDSILDPWYQVEHYLRHQGKTFVERFDANSYLYISRAMDLYDAAARWGKGDLVEACRRITSKVMVVSFTSDWLYTPAQCREFALAMTRAGKSVTYVEVPSRYGHDAFLVETEQVGRLLRYTLEGLEGKR